MAMGSRPPPRCWPDNDIPTELASTIDLYRRFVDNHEQGTLLGPEQSASSLLALLVSPENGQIWEAADRVWSDRSPETIQGGQ
jgi:hypothetical protein